MAIQVPKQPFLVCLVAILVGIASISKANAQAGILGITINLSGQLFCSPNAALPGPPLANATVNLVVRNTIIATSTTTANGTFTINANVSLINFIDALGAAVTVNLPIRTCPALANVNGVLIGFPLRLIAVRFINGVITIGLGIPSSLTLRPA